MEDAWERTLQIARALRARVVVFQCPARFAPTDEHLANLRRFFTRARREGLRFAWEPRGAWPAAVIETLCRELDLIHCVDPFAASPQHRRSRYYRLHGIGGHRFRYTDEDLERLRSLCAGPTYVMFNNVSMWEDALRFQRLVGSQT